MKDMRTWTAASTILCAFSICLSGRAQESAVAADPGAAGLKIPLLAVVAGGTLSSQTLDAVALGLGSPVIRGQEIENTLNMISLPKEFSEEEWERTFDAGESSFFHGDLEAAQQRFDRISTYFKEHPEVLAFYPSFRATVFKSRIHLAVIAHGKGDLALFNRHLQEAAAIDEMTLSPSEFPPWVCSAFEPSRRAAADIPKGSIVLAAKKGCVLSLLGRVMGQGPVFQQVPQGETFARVRCGDRSSPVQRILIPNGKKITFHPVLIFNTVLERQGFDIVLTAPANIDEARWMRDLAEIGAVMKKDRLVAVVAKPGATEIVLFDVGLKRAVRRASSTGEKAADAVEDAAHALLEEATNTLSPVPTQNNPRLRRPWYKDWVAWTLAVSGAALLGAGVGLCQTYHLESRQAPFAIALMATGGGLLATGGVLFFVQPADPSTSAAVSKTTFGAAVGGTF